MQCALAEGAANIKIKVSGPIHDNRYFLCIPNTGCLSIKAAKRGKVFPKFNGLEMNTIFITDLSTLRVYNQGLPKSCHVTVNTKQTITIYGNLVKRNDRIDLDNLRCAVS